MSTGVNCEVIEVEPGKWFYILEETDAPRNSWDWREYASASGPFTSQESAEQHLADHHANPGGHEICRYVPGFQPDAVLAALLRDSEA
ncbi:hypothetical protein [Streptomyces sp. NPDC094468]|uniref:hypothetical protein n=1 Tax=Streptomyces sp. NPDC094468 TaxID=3366066 RepID=UPI00381E73E6